MIRLIRSIAALLFGCALLLLGNGLLNTVLILRGSLEGLSDQSLGLVMSGYFVGFLLGGYWAVPLIHRVGHIRAFAFCAALLACCVLAYLLWINLWFWLVLRVLTGFALVGLYTVMESWLNGQTGSEQRGELFSIYMVVNLGALALSQQLIRIDSPANFTLFAIAAAFAAAAVMPLTWTRMTPPQLHPAPMLHVRSLYRAAPVAMVGAGVSGLAMGAFWGLAPLHINNLGYAPAQIGTFMSLAIIGGAALQIPLGRYSDAHDRRKVMVAASFGAALAALLVWSSGDAGSTPALPFYLAGALYGGFAFALQPIAVAHMIDHLQAQDILSGSTGLLQVHGIGAAVGPALAGLLMENGGNAALPVFFLGMHAFLGIYVIFAIKHSGLTDESSEQQGHFVPLTRTSATILDQHPDQPQEPLPQVPQRREDD